MENIKHFLEAEIYMAIKRAEEFPSPFYNGVNVGYKQSKKLNDKHIAFCQYLLNKFIYPKEEQDENV